MPEDNPFWAFSLAVYRKPGVAEACLRLQDGGGADVNLLLYCCWMAGVADAPLGRDAVAKAAARTEDWRAGVVVPLRAVRRRMKEGFAGVPAESAESLRSEVKRAELAAERLQQDMLYRGSRAGRREALGGPAPRQRALENISNYLSVIGAPETPETIDDCSVLIDAALPG